jgi:hypothetical protein
MNLSPPSAYGNIVNQFSNQIGTLFLVEPGDPDDSYLFRKISSCTVPDCLGSRMPRDLPPLRADQIELLIRTWIVTGAQP